MNLVDHIFNRAVEAAKPIQDLANGLKACATELVRIGQTVAVLVHNQAVHHNMIQQLWYVQQQVFQKLSDRSLDMSMPDIDIPEKVDPKDEVLKAREDAKNKPN